MEISDGTAGNNSLDHFGHHTYAPGGPPLPSISAVPWPHVPIELFTIASSIPLEPVHDGNRNKTNANDLHTSENIIVRPEEISTTPNEPTETIYRPN